MFFEISLCFLLVNLDMIVIWTWLSVAFKRKFGFPEGALVEMFQG